MKRILISLLSLALVFGPLGCGRSAPQRRQEAVSQGVYAVNDGLKNGRYDISFRYSAELVKIVPPPEKRIPVKPIKIPAAKPIATDGQPKVGGKLRNVVVDVTGKYFAEPDTSLGENAIILPPSAANMTVIVEDSPEYKALLEKYESIRKQRAEEKKSEAKFEKGVEKVQRDDAKTVAKAEASHKNIFQKIGSWFSFLSFFSLTGIILTIAGIIVLCVLFPPLVPMVMSVAGRLFSAGLTLVNTVLAALARRFKKSNP